MIVDLPGGKGKVELAPDPVIERHGREVIFRAPLGGTARYVEPIATDLSCSTATAVALHYRTAATAQPTAVLEGVPSMNVAASPARTEAGSFPDTSLRALSSPSPLRVIR